MTLSDAAECAGQTVHGRWMTGDFDPGLVSIIIPTWNRSAMLADALESVWNQTYRPLEVLVVDDGSTDNSLEMLGYWAAQRTTDGKFRVRALRQTHLGAPAARNLGLVESRGEFIQFLDSDDALVPDKLRLSLEVFMAEPGVGYVVTGRTFVEDAVFHKAVGHGAAADRSAGIRRLHGNQLSRIPSQAVLGVFRRDLCRAMGPWDESLVRHQDWEYTTRMLAFLESAVRIDSPLYLIRRHDRGRIDDLRSQRREAVKARAAALLAAERRLRVQPGIRSDLAAVNRRLRSRQWKVLRNSIKAAYLPTALLALKQLVGPPMRPIN